MMNLDPFALSSAHQLEIQAEADRARLAAQLPSRPSVVRRGLAAVCLRLANWLDAPAGYVQIPETGHEDWVIRGLSV